MSFLTYLGEEIATLALLPRRVYSRIDAFEPPDEGPGSPPTVTFDSLDADWFDREGSDIPWLGAVDILEEVNRRISAVGCAGGTAAVVPSRGGRVVRARVRRRRRRRVSRQPVRGSRPAEGEMVPAGGAAGPGAGSMRSPASATSATPPRTTFAPLSPLPPAPIRSIYDVGHGNRTALVDGREVKAVLRLRRRRAAQPRNIPGTLEQLLPVRGGDDHPVPLGLRSLVFRPARHTSAVTDMDRV